MSLQKKCHILEKKDQLNVCKIPIKYNDGKEWRGILNESAKLK